MEREILFTGIGGQGIQLAAQVLARAALHEERHVTSLGTYGGTMRGGNTDSTLIVSDAPVSAPPIVSKAWGALVMHHRYWEPMRPKLRPGGVVLINASLFEGEVDRAAWRVFDVPAGKIAAELGSPLAASLVLVGAFAGATGLLRADSLVAGLRESLPAYRTQHLEANEKALRAGHAALPAGAAPAWSSEGAAA